MVQGILETVQMSDETDRFQTNGGQSHYRKIFDIEVVRSPGSQGKEIEERVEVEDEQRG